MPDLANRTEHEDRIAQGLIAVYGDIERAMLHRPAALDWPAYRKRVEDACIAALLLIYLAGVDGFTSGVANAAEIPQPRVQDRAIVYSQQVGRTLAAEMMDAMQIKANDILRAYRSGEITREDFERMTHSLTDRSRAETVAATETTRANTHAERWAADQTAAQTGKRLAAVWNTERDGKVCPICAPLHGRIDAGWQSVIPAGPPAHPNCRCFLTYKPYLPTVTA